jgi:hypothetical protein
MKLSCCCAALLLATGQVQAYEYKADPRFEETKQLATVVHEMNALDNQPITIEAVMSARVVSKAARLLTGPISGRSHASLKLRFFKDGQLIDERHFSEEAKAWSASLSFNDQRVVPLVIAKAETYLRRTYLHQ